MLHLPNELREAKFSEAAFLHCDDGPADQRFLAISVLASPLDGDLLYVCGPMGFLTRVRGAAVRLGWQAEAIKTERFTLEIRLRTAFRYTPDIAGSKWPYRAVSASRMS
jgi:ferredoxin-NADP reductase